MHSFGVCVSSLEAYMCVYVYIHRYIFMYISTATTIYDAECIHSKWKVGKVHHFKAIWMELKFVP